MDMYQQYKPLILSTVYMLVGLYAAVYSIFISRYDAYTSDLLVAQKVISDDKESLQEVLRKREEKEKAAKEKGKKDVKGINYLPEFLNKVNKIASNNKVIIRTLTPDAENKFRFTLTFLTDYYTFLRFTAELESLDIIVGDLQVHPYDRNKTPPIHAISFSLIPRNDAKDLGGERLDKMKAWVAKKNKRDPFQRFAFDPNRKKDSIPLIDLTWIHKLGGIGENNGRKYATIDRANYFIGSSFKGKKKITEIGAAVVYLEETTDNGLVRYKIGQRKRK